LAEVYDATPAASSTAASPRLINVSALTQVQATNVLTIGFVVSGSINETVLIRAIGPSLASFGVSGALAAPRLTLLGSGAVLASNTGWGGTANLTTTFAAVGAFALSPTSADSALVATLPAGSYTAQIVGVGGTTGTVLAELYEVP